MPSFGSRTMTRLGLKNMHWASPWSPHGLPSPRRKAASAAYVILACLLVVLGGWTALRLATARADLAAAQAQLAGVKELLPERGDGRAGPTQGPVSATEAFRSVGATIQEAASESGLGSGAVREVSPAALPSGGGSAAMRAYRVRVADARVEGLVKFIYLLGEKAGLQAVELEMDRMEGQGGLWSASLLVARAG